MEANKNTENKPVKYKGQYKKSKGGQQLRQFTPRKRVSECEDDGTCDLCALPIEIYGIGSCDHPICYRCSAKMRILCEQTHCAVCRVEMKKVKMRFEVASQLKSAKPDKSNNWFTDEEVKKKYKKLFQHTCGSCPDRDPDFTFDLLQVHVRKVHQRFFCDICVKYNKNFTEEYKTYTRETLARHRRMGDEDDTSHRGHPICEYCDLRYLDSDSLLRHLRLDHYFCHFCDQLGSNQYYGEYKDLRVHFRKGHFLCEIDECVDEQFTSVFPTELDLKAHRAAVHSRNLNKQQQKADRNIDLGFQYARPPGRGGRGIGISSDIGRGRGGRGRGRARDEDLELAKALSLQEISNKEPNRSGRPTVERPQTKTRDPEPPRDSPVESPNPLNLAEDFPGLGASVYKPPPVTSGTYLSDIASDPPAVTSVAPSNTTAVKLAAAVGRSTGSFSKEEDFPSLGSSKVRQQSSGVWGGTPLAGPQGSGSRPRTKKKSNAPSMPVSVNVPQPVMGSRSRIDVKDSEQFPSLGKGANLPLSISSGWVQTPTVHPKRTYNVSKAKNLVSQEPVRNTFQAKPTKSKISTGNSDNIVQDEIISVRQGFGKHGMQITMIKQSEEISGIERPMELPSSGAGSMSIKTVDPATFSLLSGQRMDRASQNSGFDHFMAEGNEFPELGGGARNNSRVKGFGISKTEGTTLQSNWKQDSRQQNKKKIVSLAEISNDIFPSSKVDTISALERPKKKHSQQERVKKTEKNISTAPKSNLTESRRSNPDIQLKSNFATDDFPSLGNPQGNELSSSPNWYDEEELKVADKVIKMNNFQMEENEFPSLGGVGSATRNQTKKGKKKKKNKNAQSATEVSKHFKGAYVDTSQNGELTGNGHLAALLRDADGSTDNSLSSILQEHNIFVSNGGSGKNKDQLDDSQQYAEDMNDDIYISLMDQKPSKKDIDGRNEWLFNAIELLCGTDKKYSDFKTASAKYRRGTISGNEYYKTCRTLLGKRYFSEVFTELVDLLPDQDKQEELTQIHVP